MRNAIVELAQILTRIKVKLFVTPALTSEASSGVFARHGGIWLRQAHLSLFRKAEVRFVAEFIPQSGTPQLLLVTPQPCRLDPSLKQPTGLFLYARPYCRTVRCYRPWKRQILKKSCVTNIFVINL